MYRVILIPTEELPQREIWLDVEDVREAEGGTSWDFFDRDNKVIRRLPKSVVKSMEVTPDRRKPRGSPEPVSKNYLKGSLDAS